jgi:hypothetical protein
MDDTGQDRREKACHLRFDDDRPTRLTGKPGSRRDGAAQARVFDSWRRDGEDLRDTRRSGPRDMMHERKMVDKGNHRVSQIGGTRPNELSRALLRWPGHSLEFDDAQGVRELEPGSNPTTPLPVKVRSNLRGRGRGGRNYHQVVVAQCDKHGASICGTSTR